MNKIMFKDKFNLTWAVLNEFKTMTRRTFEVPYMYKGKQVAGYFVHKRINGEYYEVCMHDADEREIEGGEILPRYKIGEVVAVAQQYKDVDDYYNSAMRWKMSTHGTTLSPLDAVSAADIRKWKENIPLGTPGWNNKMFTKAEFLPHHIVITDIKIERLQSISNYDCLKEGITTYTKDHSVLKYSWLNSKEPWEEMSRTPREAFAKIIGKKIWEENPFVFVYSFILR